VGTDIEEYPLFFLPIPKRQRQKKYPFAKMQVGQSFVVTKDDLNKQSFDNLCYRWSKNTGKSFSCCTLIKNKSIQIMRIK
jgi:hypothetical protein